MWFGAGLADPDPPNAEVDLIRLWLRRTGVFALVLIIASFAARRSDQSSVEWRLSAVAQANGFDLWTWEARTLAQRTYLAIVARPPTEAATTVERYLQLTRDLHQAEGARDLAWAKQSVLGGDAGLAADQARVDGLEGQVASLRLTVESTVSAQMENELAQQQVRSSLLEWRSDAAFPFARPVLTPGVFFQLGSLPNLIVVSPRDKIELVASVLLQPDLSPTAIDRIEGQADGLNVSSVVTGIGGLAAYPSMLPDATSAADLLVTVGHEWTHHYLALRPLGMHYFDNYQMREINETVADMVGHEVGLAVYESTYRPLEPPPAPAAPSRPTGSRPDFGTLMRDTRTTVEGYLARHDVAGAEVYMRQRQQELAQEGYYVRRLNTAYLSFFGSYSGSGNPVEDKLRRVRSQAGSLAAFLDAVSQIRTTADLDRLASGP